MNFLIISKMIESHILKLDNSSENKISMNKINLDYKLDFFLVIGSNDKDYVGIIEKKIIDLIINKIHIEDSYKDFTIALDRINTIIKDYNRTSDKYLNILLGILDNNSFIFSTIGQPSVYLLKETNETIEITNKNENKKIFSYISQGELEHNDILIISNTRLLDFLSYSDFQDSIGSQNVEKINKNIGLILGEEVQKNVGIFTIKYTNKQLKIQKHSEKIQILKDFGLKILDNNFVKIIIAYYKIITEKIQRKSKFIKNILLILGILLSAFFLYFVLNNIVSQTIKTDNTQNNIELLKQAKRYKILAEESKTNPDRFLFNITKVEDIIAQLKKEKFGLNDLQLLENDLNILKKTFIGIETFRENQSNIIYQIPENINSKIVRVIKNNGKIYAIFEKQIVGPIIGGIKEKNYIFDKIGNDIFIDATIYNTSILLLTKNGKIVEFTKSGTFIFKDVIGQDTWEKANNILSYNQNLYLTNKTQIYKHIKYSNKFNKAKSYLKEKDSKNIGKISSIAIDGGFYILKNDLNILKFFSNPYRIEKIELKNMPKSYISIGENKKKIIARKDLNYVYILLNNKIWILKPNTRFYDKVNSLKYLGQIETSNEKIIDFFVEQDGKIILINKKGIYKINYTENDGKIILNN